MNWSYLVLSFTLPTSQTFNIGFVANVSATTTVSSFYFRHLFASPLFFVFLKKQQKKNKFVKKYEF
jgi:hypothetical protein